MRICLFLLMILTTACTVDTPPTARLEPEKVEITRGAKEALAAYERVRRRIEPVAERECRRRNPRAPRTYCDFRVMVDTSEARAPNAFQTIGKDGRPIIAFNVPMLVTVKNDHEIAFIMGHEAGHQIANHLIKANTSANLGATLLGGIVAGLGGSSSAVSQAQSLGGVFGSRAFSKEHELDADVIGAHIANAAGYDPLIGARSFARFTGGGGLLATHPPSAQRLAAVQATVARIRSQ